MRSLLAVVAFILSTVVNETAHPAVAAPCVGDCSGDGVVAVNELITGVNIAAGTAATCSAFGEVVGPNQLVSALAAALYGCTPTGGGLTLVPAGTEFLVNTYTEGQQFDAEVATDAAGSFIVVWAGGTGSDDSGIAARRFDSSGTPLGSQFSVNTVGYEKQSYPDVAMRPDGAFLVVWSTSGIRFDESDPRGGIYGQLYTSSGAPQGPEFKINTFDSYLETGPVTAALADGGFVVAWSSAQQADSSTSGIYARRLDNSATPVGGEFAVNTYTTGLQTVPAVAANPDGGFVVVWDDAYRDGNNFGVFGQRFDSTGTPLGSDFQVNTYTTGVQSRSSVAVSADGTFLVAWRASLFSDNVFAQRFDSTGKRAGTEFMVNTTQLGFHQYPSVAAEPGGGYLIVWQGQNGGTVFDIYGQRFDGNGDKVGSEFVVNTYTLSTTARTAPEAAISPSANVVVVWQSNGQETSAVQDIGIYGQRYQLQP